MFGVFYRPPSSDSECLEILQRNTECLPHQTNIMLVGNFNFNHFNWKNNLFLNNSLNCETLSDRLSDDLINQMVPHPTKCDNTLDLTLSNNLISNPDLTLFDAER